MKELFGLIDHDLKQSGFKRNLKAGIVLTGGGSLLRGSKDLAEEVFGLPARLGVPLDLGAGLSREIEKPEFATLVGLIKNIPGVVSNDIYSPKYGKKSWRLLEKLKEFFDEL
jgi:cell division protein FtsA